MPSFNGLNMNLGNLSRLSAAQTRSISAENFTGAQGQGGMATEGLEAGPARELGQGWKVSPCISVPARQTVTLADIEGSGAIQHIWITVAPAWWRKLVHPVLLGRRRPHLRLKCPWAISSATGGACAAISVRWR